MKQIKLFILILLTITTACNKSGSVQEEHDHSHDAVKLMFTKYSDRYELFMESDPFVKDKPVNILAHFTQISDFKPLSTATITASLVKGENSVEQTIESTSTPGIFKFTLKPGKSGAHLLRFDIKTKSGEFKLEIDNVVVYGDEHTAALVAEKKQVANVNAIKFTKEQSWKIDFGTILPSVVPLGNVIKSTAHVYNNPKSEIMVSAKTNGVVNIVNNMFEGQNIDADQLFMIISGKDLANDNTEIRFVEAKNKYELAKSDYERKKALSQNQIVSEKELEISKENYENAKVIFENLNKNFSSQGQKVTTTQPGIVKHIFVENGQYVEAGEPLFSIVNNENLIIKSEVQQKYYSYLAYLQTANFRSPVSNKMYSLEELNGKLLSYGKNIDAKEGYLIPAYFEIRNNGEFLPGGIIEAYLKTKAKQKNLVVPVTALIEEQGNYFVFVQITPELFEKREVEIGDTDGEVIAILSGLVENERIVSKGAIIVKLAAVSNSLDPHAGHVH